MARNVPYIERPIKVIAIANSIHLGSWQLLSARRNSHFYRDANIHYGILKSPYLDFTGAS
jgi:hypothetical protein